MPVYRQFRGQNAISKLEKTSLENLGSALHGQTVFIENTSAIDTIADTLAREAWQQRSAGWIYIYIGIVLLLFSRILLEFSSHSV